MKIVQHKWHPNDLARILSVTLSTYTANRYGGRTLLCRIPQGTSLNFKNTLPHLTQLTPILNKFSNNNKSLLGIRLSISLRNKTVMVHFVKVCGYVYGRESKVIKIDLDMVNLWWAKSWNFIGIYKIYNFIIYIIIVYIIVFNADVNGDNG